MTNFIYIHDQWDDIKALDNLYKKFTNTSILDSEVQILKNTNTIDLVKDYYLINGRRPCITEVDPLTLNLIEIGYAICIINPNIKGTEEMIKVLESNNNCRKIHAFKDDIPLKS